MAHEKQYILAERLIAQTKRNSLDWQATPAENSFATVLGSYTLRITEGETEHFSDEPVFLYTIMVLDKDGNIVEAFNDEDLYKDISIYRPQIPGFYQALKETFGQIRRQVYKLDEKMDEVLSAIQIGNKRA